MASPVTGGLQEPEKPLFSVRSVAVRSPNSGGARTDLRPGNASPLAYLLRRVSGAILLFWPGRPCRLPKGVPLGYLRFPMFPTLFFMINQFSFYRFMMCNYPACLLPL